MFPYMHNWHHQHWSKVTSVLPWLVSPYKNHPASDPGPPFGGNFFSVGDDDFDFFIPDQSHFYCLFSHFNFWMAITMTDIDLASCAF